MNIIYLKTLRQVMNWRILLWYKTDYQSNKISAIIYVVQDGMTAAYLFTQPFTKVDKRMFNNLMMSNKEFNGILPKPDENGLWSGRDVFSMFLPDISVNANNIT